MRVVVTQSEQELGARAADLVAEVVRARPQAVLGVATGSSPLPLYRELGRRVEAGELSLAGCSAFMLDEYVGLAENHPQRYRQVILRDLVQVTDLDPGRVHGPDGLAGDPHQAALDYDRQIRESGGVDVQVCGLGTDGHIAFNEPGSSLASRTRVMPLAAQTRKDNARFFDGDEDAVPRQCITQGVGTIMEARRVVVLAQGEQKAEAVRQLVEGAVSAMWTCTALQWHPDVVVVVDEAAASRLTLRDHFRAVEQDVPEWRP